MLKAFDGGRLFGASYGADRAPWVLALHGWARSHQDWRAVLGASDPTFLLRQHSGPRLRWLGEIVDRHGRPWRG